MSAEILAVIPKSQDAEIRVIRDSFKDKVVVDVRIWFRNKDNQYVRSRKGFTVEERNFPRFIESIASIEL